MMRKLLNYILLLPVAIVLILLSVANRQWTRFSLDPLNSESPALFVDLPLFVYLFVALLLGMLLGGFLVWRTQGKHRRALREKSFEVTKLKREQDRADVTPAGGAEIAPGLPVATRS